MGAEARSLSEEIASFFKATWMELPFAAASRALGGSDKDLGTAGWRAYDSWVALANEATNQLYTNRAFADFSARVFEATLRWQQATGLLMRATQAATPRNPGLPPAEYNAPVRMASGLTRPARRPSKRRSRRTAVQSPADTAQNRETDRAITA